MTELLRPQQAANLLHVTYGTLASWRHNRRYPLAFVRIGRKIFYRQEDIEAYIAASVVSGNGPRNQAITKKR
jgi:excisionase family DNA binding protein